MNPPKVFLSYVKENKHSIRQLDKDLVLPTVF